MWSRDEALAARHSQTLRLGRERKRQRHDASAAAFAAASTPAIAATATRPQSGGGSGGAPGIARYAPQAHPGEARAMRVGSSVGFPGSADRDMWSDDEESADARQPFAAPVPLGQRRRARRNHNTHA